MSKDRSYYYMILGLKPGASPKEIKAAFRRFVKLYHPDRDKSLDAEIKYNEIREACEALLKWHADNAANAAKRTKPTPKTKPERRTEDTTWDMEDLMKSFAEKEKEKSGCARFFAAIIGGVIPVLLTDEIGHGYVTVGIALSIASYFLILFLEKDAFFNKRTTGRLFFWFPFTISSEWVVFAHSGPLLGYIFPIIILFVGLFIPAKIFMKHREW